MKKLILAAALVFGITFTGATAQAAKPVTVDAVYFEDMGVNELFLTSSAPVVVTDKDIAKFNTKLVYGNTYVITYADATAQEIVSIKIK